MIKCFLFNAFCWRELMQKKIGVFVGSLRKDSSNRKVARALQKLAPHSLQLEIVEIGDLPFYNQDREENPPREWMRFRDQVRPMDGVLFVTPEYNRSVPAVLKNALDVGSRPYGSSVWDGKPGAIVSVTSGGLGAFGANHHLRQSMVFLNVPTMQQPEAYISKVGDLLDEAGEIKTEDGRKFFVRFMDAFEKWVEMHKAAKRAN
jgi:chromate reductase